MPVAASFAGTLLMGSGLFAPNTASTAAGAAIAEPTPITPIARAMANRWRRRLDTLRVGTRCREVTIRSFWYRAARVGETRARSGVGQEHLLHRATGRISLRGWQGGMSADTSAWER